MLCENIRQSSLGRELDNDQRVVGLEHMVSGKVLQEQFGDCTAVSGSVTKFIKGDVLYGKLRPNLRKVSIATFDGFCTTEILVLRPNGTYSSEYLHAILSSKFVLNEVLRYAKGTKMPRVNPGDLLAIHVPNLAIDHVQQASEELKLLNRLEKTKTDSLQSVLELLCAFRESSLTHAEQGAVA